MLNVGKFEAGYRLIMLVIPTKGDKLKNVSYIVSLYLYLLSQQYHNHEFIPKRKPFTTELLSHVSKLQSSSDRTATVWDLNSTGASFRRRSCLSVCHENRRRQP